jgi:hypothetical protein
VVGGDDVRVVHSEGKRGGVVVVMVDAVKARCGGGEVLVGLWQLGLGQDRNWSGRGGVGDVDAVRLRFSSGGGVPEIVLRENCSVVNLSREMVRRR